MLDENNLIDNKYKYYLDIMCQNCESYPCNNFKTGSRCLALSTLGELADTAYKYRWHNIRKDPEDLPPIDNLAYGYFPCIVAFQTDDGEIETDYCEYAHLENVGYVFFSIPHSDIIAWKEIEPYREVDAFKTYVEKETALDMVKKISDVSCINCPSRSDVLGACWHYKWCDTFQRELRIYYYENLVRRKPADKAVF